MQKQRLITEIQERIDTEYKMRLAEERLKGSLKEKEVLIKEVHHRVKNNLQIIISLIRLQTSSSEDKNKIIYLSDILNRIKSIALVHELLYRSKDLSKIDMNEYLNKIVDSLKVVYNEKSEKIDYLINTNNIFLTIDKAVPCAIIINELITNSIKHAFNYTASGIVSVSFEYFDQYIKLKISDNGVGLSDNFDIHRVNSLGMVLISSLAEQLDASLNILSDNGTTFEFKFLYK